MPGVWVWSLVVELRFCIQCIQRDCLCLDGLIMICFSVALFEFILHEVYWASWICKLMFFIKFGKFLAIISSNSLPALFSLFFFRELPVCLGWCAHWCPAGLIDIVHFSSFFFLLLRLDNFVGWFLLLSAQNCYWLPLVKNFHFIYCNFQCQNSYIIYFCSSDFFIDILYLVWHSSHAFF